MPAPAPTREHAAAHDPVPSAFGLWIAGVVVLALLAHALGASARAAATAAAIGVAPAFCGLLLQPRHHERWALSASIDAWTAAAALSVALTGGASSPLAAGFVIAPALALRLGGASLAAESAGVSVLGFAAAAGSARIAGVSFDAPVAGAFTILVLALAGWLLSGARAAPPVSAPAPRPDLLQGFARAAHELRTPLNHILGFAELMQREVFGPLPQRYAEYAGLIVSSGRNMQGLATRWLDLARLDAGRFEIAPEPVDVSNLVRRAVEAAQATANARGQQLDVTGADGAQVIEADPMSLRQILDNLLSNALKFSPDGGRVTVRLIAGSHACIIDVEDTGAGISDADKERLGAPFERGAGAGAFEGAGLGLMIVKGLLAAHRGRLDILDAEGGGTLMRVVLPSVQAPA